MTKEARTTWNAVTAAILRLSSSAVTAISAKPPGETDSIALAISSLVTLDSSIPYPNNSVVIIIVQKPLASVNVPRARIASRLKREPIEIPSKNWPAKNISRESLPSNRPKPLAIPTPMSDPTIQGLLSLKWYRTKTPIRAMKTTKGIRSIVRTCALS